LNKIRRILEKVKALGWGQEVDNLTEEEEDDFLSIKGVYISQPLTERGTLHITWKLDSCDKNPRVAWEAIKGDVLDFLQRVRTINALLLQLQLSGPECACGYCVYEDDV
jgi:hypothetical protein